MSTVAAAPPMSSLPAHAAPPWRALALLAAAVLAAHALVLTSVPARFGPERDLAPKPAPAFVTRSIAPPPPAEPAAPPAVTMPKPLPKPSSPKPRPAPAPAPEAAPSFDTAAAATTTAASAPAAEPQAVELPPEPPAAAASSPAVAASGPALPETTKVGVVRLPQPVQLSYKTEGAQGGKNYYGSSELSWRTNGTEYTAVLAVKPSFPVSMFIKPRVMTSEGLVTESGLAPRRFGDKWRSERAAHFETDKGKVTFSANTADAPWIAGTQDRMSFFLQLAGMLAGSPGEFAPGSSISLYTVGPTQADVWTFLVEAEETISGPGGDLQALKLSRKPRHEFDQKVEVWFAPSLDYLPAKSRITERNGDFVEQSLQSVSRP